ncbi:MULTISPECIES: circularly permuted type 2 ATP-grasp protein [Leptolyngbya]|uniref:Circularly permuted ATP-grasp type 2 domain-containing protein n=2 Tax=Leptolyngbya boryana TaxID=1184 RepID=A0A1Z4JKJ2_LEPBY|nr:MULTISPECIES: circularly permuted type 2 ATP-grasp protein [Leptolyngbya]MBD1857417.1 circularly permuted type 2 ATP-grasp protein [Leptolyngbya sp. FACHB-1624]MBD2366978.1 circularly permuted type 2 ATP-grasp protein [Leptolyngbya sp. FACHB-161]MBD2373668.1 circularly permuted type 2 ATP-grasp protein [Leptolyngbya sp. FACHB-238]MBD2398077.1 circularly permuted type 2 ATP-grasp protein [Leptolyngbya sp. FACHB-239]MBD2404579.1 circularly permuted type 2 ATP-grasp protein [Leptolyngbya sp. F
MKLANYDPGHFYDELFDAPGRPRPEVTPLIDRINSLSIEEIQHRQQAAQIALFKMGVTFNVYGDEQGTEKIFPFDILPRTIAAAEWQILEKGLKQRIVALNEFLADVYGDQKIIQDGVIPSEIVFSSRGFLKPCMGLKPPKGIWSHISGMDLVRDRTGEWYILEDNLRCPSGVSYVLESRRIMKSTLPLVFNRMNIQPVEEYPSYLLETLLNLAPDYIENPTVVLLTPGIYNSAYFEHSYLAQQMGVELVEGRDLVIADGYLQMRTTKGLKRVDVIYRRIDDEFIDPLAFRPDSLLGVPGLMDVYRSGRLGLANALGTGIADDKVIYAYVPEMIRYYLGEDAILSNVPTYLCWEPSQLSYVLANLDKLVVKAANESGGYGMLIGSQSTEAERAEFAEKIKAAPRNYIAQPTLCLSRVPALMGDEFEGCHVDLRPYILYGEDIYITPGGLTRVALKRGSLVVNSSQGGGYKDTWVVS